MILADGLYQTSGHWSRLHLIHRSCLAFCNDASNHRYLVSQCPENANKRTVNVDINRKIKQSCVYTCHVPRVPKLPPPVKLTKLDDAATRDRFVFMSRCFSFSFASAVISVLARCCSTLNSAFSLMSSPLFFWLSFKPSPTIFLATVA